VNLHPRSVLPEIALRPVAPFSLPSLPVAGAELAIVALALAERLALGPRPLAERSFGSGFGLLRPLGTPEIALGPVIPVEIPFGPFPAPGFSGFIAAPGGVELTLRAELPVRPLGETLACRLSCARPALAVAHGFRTGLAF
jgi:hypothetical protein